MAPRMTWSEVCQSDQFRGRWVALDRVRYAAGSSEPVEAEVVDADEDLAELCGRMRSAGMHACKILFCDEAPPPQVSRFQGRDAAITRAPVSVRRPVHH